LGAPAAETGAVPSGEGLAAFPRADGTRQPEIDAAVRF
jgi:hypothetical protein